MNSQLKKLQQQRFIKKFRAFTQEHKIPQAVAGLVENGKLSQICSTDLEGQAIDNADHVIFPIASMTKCFAAVAILQLRDQGRLDLDDPVVRYLKELKDLRWQKTTIRHLLTMQTGLLTDNYWADRQMGISDAEFTNLLTESFSYFVEPATLFSYSNLSYMMLGRIISVVAGETALEVINKRILLPLGMENTSWYGSCSDCLPGFSLTDGKYSKQNLPAAQSDAVVFGGLCSNLSDLSRWIGFLLNIDNDNSNIHKQVLSLESRQELQSKQITVPPTASTLLELASYCYGLIAYNSNGIETIGHSGGLPGYGSHFRWSHEYKIGVIFLSNLTYISGSYMSREALQDIIFDLKDSTKEVTEKMSLRAQELIKFLREPQEKYTHTLFASNFALDFPWSQFQKSLHKLAEYLSFSDISSYLLLPDPDASVRIVLDGQELARFSLAPAEAAKIQSLEVLVN